MIDVTKKRFPALALGVVLAAVFPLSGLAQETSSASWSADIYNPAAEADLLTLPLPCGGQIGLVRVVTDTVDANEAPAPLSDREISLGRPFNQTRSYIEFRRTEHLTGSLNDPSNGQRFYLIGAYEVTAAQYEAVMSEPNHCPAAPQRKDMLPAANLSWYDAVEFTRRLNAWIYSGTSNHLAALSQLGVDNGFVRLPTEAEWEFAARGGEPVGDAQRNEPVFFSEGTLDDYAWYNGAMSSGGKLKPVGGKKRNPLGLYDVYGNAEEIVMEPFRMTSPGRLHGGIGGFVSRGGSSLDEAETLSSARRDERPFFDVGMQGEYKRRTLGFRIAVGTSSLPTDLTRIPLLEAAAERLQRQVPGEAEDQPVAQIARAAEQIDDGPLRQEIQALNAQLSAEFARRNELEAMNLQTSLMNAVMFGRELYLSERHLRNLEDLIPLLEGEERAAQIEENKREKQSFDLFFDVYMANVMRFAVLSAEDVRIQSRKIESALTQQQRGAMRQFLTALNTDITSYRRDGLSRTIARRIDQLQFTRR